MLGFLLSLSGSSGPPASSPVDKLLIPAKSGDKGAREELLRQYTPLVLRVGSQVSGRYLQVGRDEEVSVGLLALNEAIDRFDAGRGASFISFSEMVIKRRLIDFYRRQKGQGEIPLSELESEDDEGNLLQTVEHRQAQASFALVREAEDRKDEIVRYSKRLSEFGIRFSELVEISPKHEDARDRALEAELLAELCGTSDYVMMLAGDVLRVSLVTIHEALKDVPGLVSFERVLKTIRVTESGVRRLTGIPRPHLAVLALNPHCGEGGMFGNEERDIIGPAIQAAQAEGIDAVGPLSADTLFHFAQQGAYDGVVAMYHDQGLIPLKMLHFDDAVNVTLGLPIIRTSPDHGTGYDIAGQGSADPRSMLEAVNWAERIILNRRKHQSAR